MDGYPVGLVLNLARVARANRRRLAVELAVGVSLGIRDALGTEGRLLQAWLAEDAATAARAPGGDNPLKPWIQGLPVVTRRRRPN